MSATSDQTAEMERLRRDRIAEIVTADRRPFQGRDAGSW